MNRRQREDRSPPALIEGAQPRRTRRRPGSCWLLFACLAATSLCTGCPSVHSSLVSTPNRFELQSDDILIRSDLKIRSDHPILGELKEIRQELTALLNLPPAKRPIVVHLFGDENRYATYMKARHPNLPPRRAFFIGSPTELGVYAHWSANVAEDLRHEYTHGVLHASLRTVPLWLDEGLAEYFETRNADPQRRHPEHVNKLALAMKNGWRPDLARLEQIENISQMRTAEYQESWAWVHYLLHEVPDGRALLVDYCESLNSSDKPPRFGTMLARHFPDPESRLSSYITLSLTGGETAVRTLGQSDSLR